MKLAELKGSQKQIAWAEDIRKDMIERLDKDTKLVDKYLQIVDNPNTDQKELKELQEKIDKKTLYSDDTWGNHFSLKVTLVNKEHFSNELDFNDREDQEVNFNVANIDEQKVAKAIFKEIKADYFKAGGQQVWNLAEKYYDIADKFGMKSDQAKQALQEWQTKAEATYLKYIKHRWNKKLANESSASWYINNRINPNFY